MGIRVYADFDLPAPVKAMYSGAQYAPGRYWKMEENGETS